MHLQINSAYLAKKKSLLRLLQNRSAIHARSPKKRKSPYEQPCQLTYHAKEEVIEPENVSPDAKKIGEEVTELLEYTSGNIYVRKIVRPKYVVATDEKSDEEDSQNATQITIADLPTLPIPRGNAGASLLAHIQVSKWIDHLPYYHQIQVYKRGGVNLSSSTINDWFNATCN